MGLFVLLQHWSRAFSVWSSSIHSRQDSELYIQCLSVYISSMKLSSLLLRITTFWLPSTWFLLYYLISPVLLLEDALSLCLLPPWLSGLCRPLTYILSQHGTQGYRSCLMSEAQRGLCLSYPKQESATTNDLRCKSVRKEGVKPLCWLSGTSHCYCHREISKFCLDCWKCQQGKEIFVCKT